MLAKVPTSIRVGVKPTSISVRKFSTQSSKLEIRNPANGQVITTVDADTSKTVAEKFARARKAQPSWRNVPLEQKKKAIEKFGKILTDKHDKFAADLTSEVGKPLSQSGNELKGVQPRLKFYLENIDAALTPRVTRETDKFKEEVRQEPLGTIANISAWNYPYFVGVNVFVPALLTGNTVVYKPSEYSTLTGTNIKNALYEAGIPEDAFQLVVGRGDVGEQLLKQDIDGVFFTGSNATGYKIAQAVAGRMIKTQFELGGKDPTYVSENFDVEKAAKSLADGAMYNTGQSCCSVERIYVNSKVYDKFVEIFVNEVKSFTVGEPTDGKTYIGPLTMPKQPDFLQQQVQDAVSKGAKVLVGGKKIQKAGNWFEPTVLVNVNHTMAVMRDESFGPIIGIQKVNNVEEAISLMNDTSYGLTSGVYTNSKEEAEKVLSKINSGTVYWNACDRVSPWLPWSGRKGSGLGATLGLEGITAFTHPKAFHLIYPN